MEAGALLTTWPPLLQLEPAELISGAEATGADEIGAEATGAAGAALITAGALVRGAGVATGAAWPVVIYAAAVNRKAVFTR